MTTTKTTVQTAYLLIHGAWMSRWVWQNMITYMKHPDILVKAIDLPGHGEKNITSKRISLNTYTDYVCQEIKSLKTQSVKRIILVGHSMAGMVISQAAARMPVDQLIYVAAFLPKPGDSIHNIIERYPHKGLSEHIIVNHDALSISLNKGGLEKRLFNTCETKCALQAIQKLQPQPLVPFNSQVHLNQQFKGTPKTYITCSQDETLPFALQQQMLKGYPCQVHCLASDHMPMLSMPEKLAHYLLYNAKC